MMTLRASRHHVLERGHLARVVAIVLAGTGDQLETVRLRGILRALLHLHEEGVGLGLRDQPDDRLLRVERGSAHR
jgi:hypothetical protein